MILPLIVRHAERGARDVERYAAWSAVIDRFIDEWKKGARPEPSDYAVPDPEAMLDLVALHMKLSWEAGIGRRLHEYGCAVDADLVEDEFLARHSLPFGDCPSIDEYEARWAARLRSRCAGNGRYVLLRRIGGGSMGVVWESCDRKLRRLVALKAGEIDREIQILSMLDHPGIAGILDSFEESGKSSCVMRLAHGATLAEMIRVKEPSTLLRAFADACDAVSYAHSRGVLHRDLKPGNIMLGNFGEIQILDWGLARLASEKDGTLSGTPEYMPPDAVATERSDVFSLGATLYEILTGRPPHVWGAGPRPSDWQSVVRKCAIIPPRRIAKMPRIPEAICLKALAPDPADRYASASELGSDIHRYLAGKPTLARPDSLLSRFRRWLALHPVSRVESGV